MAEMVDAGEVGFPCLVPAKGRRASSSLAAGTLKVKLNLCYCSKNLGQRVKFVHQSMA